MAPSSYYWTISFMYLVVSLPCQFGAGQEKDPQASATLAVPGHGTGKYQKRFGGTD